jgi:XTP/dITP diphosphohydrolase
VAAPARFLLASSNAGKLREYCALAAGHAVAVEPLPHFDSLPAFEETAPTFAENAAAKALHYSRFSEFLVMADDSGLVVPALGGAPGVFSARYAGPGASDAQRVAKLLEDMKEKRAADRSARFVCILAVAEQGRLQAVFSDFVEGTILDASRGHQGFGYDPVFLVPALQCTFAELSANEKNRLSHRGLAFAKLLHTIEFPNSPPLE